LGDGKNMLALDPSPRGYLEKNVNLLKTHKLVLGLPRRDEFGFAEEKGWGQLVRKVGAA